ncbi:MAG: hypothetical protein ACRDHL_11375 [Candidatus Promineifilaceae bacterium]
MTRLAERLGIPLFILIGGGLAAVGLLALNHILNNFWPIDVARLDLIRSSVLDQAEATVLLQAGNNEIILAFLACVLIFITGLALPFVYWFNQRFGQGPAYHFLVALRQAMWIGIWLAFSLWLQMNRSLGWGVAVLVAAVFVILEILLQVRERAADAPA